MKALIIASLIASSHILVIQGWEMRVDNLEGRLVALIESPGYKNSYVYPAKNCKSVFSNERQAKEWFKQWAKSRKDWNCIGSLADY